MKLNDIGVVVFALAPALLATGAAFAQEDVDPILGRPGDTILFNRDCADAEYYQARALALMESENGAARALVRVSTGYFRARNPRVEIGVTPMELDLDLGSGWADAEVSLRLLAAAGSRNYFTAELSSYLDSDFGREPVQRRFTTDAGGRLRWWDFVEPDLRETDADDGFNVTEGFYFDADELAVGDSIEPIRMELRLRRNDGEEEIVLTGPLFRIPDKIWEMDLPEPRALGLLESFNPLQEGGVLDWLGRGFRYRNCMNERRDARLEFQNRD